MNGEKLDIALSEMYSDTMYPSEELLKKTKSSLKRAGLLEYVIAFSIALNIIGTFIFIYMLLLSPHNILGRIAFFTVFSTLGNVVILIICLYREKVKEIFNNMEPNII